MTSLICTLPLLSALFSACDPPPPLAVGYVEGEYVLIAPIETARIDALMVRRGDHVVAGEILVKMTRDDATLDLAQADAALVRATSQLANLQLGKRPEELAMIEASLNSLRAEAADAARDLAREGDLFAANVTPRSKFEQAQTRADIADARVAELEANLAVARLPARADEIRAAEADVAQATAARDSARWRLGERQLTAPIAGTITDILRQAGEVAGPQAPVLNFLPDGAVKLRLYLPQAARSAIAPGHQLSVTCDGCPSGLSATVSYVASEPEFTPPVIYSIETRQKLVYLIEALPDANSIALRPGQIVDVTLP